jgi:nitrite reductase/ring-hydroxylating ferredoxin subunit
MAWTTLCDLADLREGEGRYVEIDGSHLAVFLHAGEVFVTDNTCPHAGGSMAGGWVQDGCAVCPWHAWMFDLRTGDLRGGSGGFHLRTYPTRRLPRPDGRVLVQADLPMP